MELLLAVGSLAACTLVLGLRARRETMPGVTESLGKPVPSGGEGPRAPAAHWPLAAGAIHAIRNGQRWDRFSYEEPLVDHGEFRRTFRQQWGVVDRRSLLRCLHWLLAEGHRATFDTMIGYYAKLSESEAGQLLLDIQRDPHLDEDERAERSWQLAAVQANAERIRATNFLAWDLLRFIELCRMAPAAGLLQRHEAEDCALIAAHELQRAFAGWQACADHFLRARRFWTASDDETSSNEQLDFVRAVHVLDASTDSPWHRVSWSMPLPEPRWLLVRALIDIDQAPLLDDEGETVYSIAVRLDDIARQMMAAPRYGT